jgi:antibiotic biosynthesis monooxygenase (ABM) superfamily enzyme
VASKNGATFEQAMQVSISKQLTPNLHRRFNKSNDTAAVVANVAGYIHNVSFLNPVTHLLGCSSL